MGIVNFTGQDARVRVVTDSGFENPSSDLIPLLNNVTIATSSSRCGYVEIDNSGTSPCTLELTLADGKTLTFTTDQQDARTANNRLLTHTGTAVGLEVWQVSGGDIDSTSHGTNGIYVRTSTPPDHSSWMRELVALKPDVKLGEVVLPGSHDAGMYTFTYALDSSTGKHPEWAKAQGSSVAGQLAAGSRYFDLRIYPYLNQLWTAHWTTVVVDYGAVGASLNDVLNDVKAFLKSPEGSGEVVILKLSHTREYWQCAAIVKRVKDILGDFDVLYVPKDENVNLAEMKLADLKGRGVALFDVEFGPEYENLWDAKRGIFPYHDVPVKAPVPVVGKGPGLTVYDNWADDTVFDRMYNDQTPKLKTYGGLGQSYLFLLSWTLSGKPGSILDVSVLAGMCNPWLPQTLDAIPSNHWPWPNVVFFDFVDPYLCGPVIAINGRVKAQAASHLEVAGARVEGGEVEAV